MGTNKQLELRSIIISLLRQGMGFGVELFGLLSIDELEDGRFRIFDQRDHHADLCQGEEHIFKDVKDAVDKFLELRQDRMLGYDFERGEAPPTPAEKELIAFVRTQGLKPQEVVKCLSQMKTQ
jgi:hypothetical protein